MNNSMYPQPIFFHGVVEAVDDPQKIGRVRVRVFGVHSATKERSDTNGIATEELPWAFVSQPVTSAAMNGIGRTSELLAGTWVHGITRDGDGFQDLVIIGTIPGIPLEKPNTKVGFSDPSGTYPKDDFIGESDINRLARNENIDKTIVKRKSDNRERDIKTAADHSWDEPTIPYNAKYPKNHVYESESGHIEEFDDTPGAERIHRYHKTGTFEEIHPDGTVVRKIVGEDYEIISKNKKILIKGSCSVTINGDAEVLVRGNSTTNVKGNETKVVNGDMNVTVKGDYNETVEGILSIETSRLNLN